MSVRTIALLLSISLGGSLGWRCGDPGGLMGSYFMSILGATIGLYIGRKIQNNLDGE